MNTSEDTAESIAVPAKLKIKFTIPRLKSSDLENKQDQKEPNWEQLRALVPVPYGQYQEDFYYFSGDNHAGIVSLICAIAEDNGAPTAWFDKLPPDDPGSTAPAVYTWWIPHFFTNGMNLVGFQKGEPMYNNNLISSRRVGMNTTRKIFAAGWMAYHINTRGRTRVGSPTVSCTS